MVQSISNVAPDLDMDDSQEDFISKRDLISTVIGFMFYKLEVTLVNIFGHLAPSNPTASANFEH